MANNKVGFDYYATETSRFQDIKIKRLKKEFKADGVAVFDYILNEIYRVKGSYIEWDSSVVFDVAEYWGLKESTVTEIVNYCCFVGLFNKGLFTSGSILTSVAIQKRYVDWCMKARRVNIQIPDSIFLLTAQNAGILFQNVNILSQNAVIISQNPISLPQSKVKESKVKESRGNTRMCAIPAPSNIDEVFLFFKSETANEGWDDKRCQNIAKKFMVEYHLKWETLKDGWQAKARKWILTEHDVSKLFGNSGSQQNHPDNWNAKYAAILDGPGHASYIKHLHALGWKPKKDNTGRVTDWIKPNDGIITDEKYDWKNQLASKIGKEK